MNFLFYCFFLVAHFFLVSCADNFDRYVNVYSDNPNNINTPNYLIINKDGSYYKISRYGDDEYGYEYVSMLEEYGTWNLERKHLNLFNQETRVKSEKFTIVSLGKNNFGLKPTLGEGRHSGRLYKPTKHKDILSVIYKKKGSYWKKVQIPFP